MVRFAQELFAIEKMAPARNGNKKIAKTLGLPVTTTKMWVQRVVHCAKLRDPHGTRAKVSLAPGQRAIARLQAGL